MEGVRKKIILVDDIKSNLDQGRLILDPFYQVYPATSAEALFRYLIKFIPDLILLDIEMPEMNGYEALKMLKADECYIDIPVIFLTAKNDEGSEREGFDLGAADYLTKPLSAPLLLKRIENQLVISEQKNQLKIALKNAEQANSAKSSFLANMSHEMRTPLNAVIGLTGLSLENEGLDEETRSNIEKIYNAGTTLLNIVNDILDISKIEAGEYELVETEYDVPSLINDTVTQNIIRIGEKPIKLKLNICEELFSRLYGDELRLKQIISNLLSNAIKYTQEGTVELSLRCDREGGSDTRNDREGGSDTRSDSAGSSDTHNDREGGSGTRSDSAGSSDTRNDGEGGSDTAWLTIQVRDTGKGIRAKDIERLFSSYAQVDAKANRNIEGIGLGLSITKRLAEMMQGTISVDSEYGKGSTFTVKVAQKFVSDVRIGPMILENLKNFRYSDEKRDRRTQFKRIKMPYARVLVVDDNVTNLAVAKGLMKPYGMQVDCVTSGQEAIAIMISETYRGEKVKYNAIFMDHMMPEMDGVEATKRIREIGSDYSKNIPIIALTANALVGNEEMFISKGFQAFLPKPVDIARMDLVLRQWVRDKSQEEKCDADSAGEVADKCGEVADTCGEATGIRGEVAETSSNMAETSGNTAETSGNTAKAYGDKVLTSGDMHMATEELSVIPGLDFHKGLRMYGNDMDIYLPILRAYAQNMPELIEKLRNVTKESLPKYAIEVHGLKGASAGIGAEDISVRGTDLEMKSKAGDFQGVLDLNRAFLYDVEILVESLDKWLAQQDTKSKKSISDAPNPSVF